MANKYNKRIKNRRKKESHLERLIEESEKIASQEYFHEDDWNLRFQKGPSLEYIKELFSQLSRFPLN